MLTLDFILKNKEIFEKSMNMRGVSYNFSKFETLEAEKKALILKAQDLQEKRNKLAKEIGLKKSKNEDASDLLKETEYVKENLPLFEENLRLKEAEILSILLQLPNILAPEVPQGKNEDDNLEIKKVGEIPTFDFKPKEHFELGQMLKHKGFDMMDFETAIKISGSRFVILHSKLSKLERGLVNFLLDMNSKRGYNETSVPFLVKPHAFVGTGQLPKFEGDFFKTTTDLFLIPTAEVSLTNIVRESLIPEKELPIRLTAATQCFRSEAGSAGKDTRGMIRQHQFTKVELVSICSPELSEKEHDYMLETAELILQSLELPYRVIMLCSGDIGATAKKTYDIEVYLPGQGRYREISSISNTGSFQSIRMNAKFKRAGTGKNEHLHTLNGSALAVGRLIVAILENFQTIDGKIKMPKALHNYLDFDVI